jgi:kynurenine formamidase
LKAIIKEQDIKIRPGDILFIRVGFTAAYNALTPAAQENYPNRQPPGLLGLEATRESLKWLWESKFAAVASDSPSFERGPTTGPYNDPEVTIHQWALAGWGLPLGEMFDLEELAETARRLGRYSFFVTSVPIKVNQRKVHVCLTGCCES